MIKWEKLPVEMQMPQVREYYDIIGKKILSRFIKRLFDVIMSLIMLILLSPVLIIIAILIKVDSKGPVFYMQERVTKYNRTFRIFKFRTMVADADRIGSLVTVGNDSRITKMGHKIRKVRLDELPQLINILKGDMTFVGTRPEVRKYVDCYSGEMMATLLMPAGVTSTASIEYKNEDEVISRNMEKYNSVDEVYVKEVLPQKMEYNLKELREFNIINDLKILIRTVVAVLRNEEM